MFLCVFSVVSVTYVLVLLHVLVLCFFLRFVPFLFWHQDEEKLGRKRQATALLAALKGVGERGVNGHRETAVVDDGRNETTDRVTMVPGRMCSGYQLLPAIRTVNCCGCLEDTFVVLRFACSFLPCFALGVFICSGIIVLSALFRMSAMFPSRELYELFCYFFRSCFCDSIGSFFPTFNFQRVIIHVPVK